MQGFAVSGRGTLQRFLFSGKDWCRFIDNRVEGLAGLGGNWTVKFEPRAHHTQAAELIRSGSSKTTI